MKQRPGRCKPPFLLVVDIDSADLAAASTGIIETFHKSAVPLALSQLKGESSQMSCPSLPLREGLSRACRNPALVRALVSS
jgi:hypothetical protein